jgi:pimeloyl-ACP methyl ester carboxylesterase
MDARTREPEIKWVAASGRVNARLATEEIGAGQPFVWGHSLLGSMAQDFDGGVLAWRELEDIAQVIRFDARGHGRSDSSGEPEDFRWDNLARSMWQVADSYTDDKVVLGGASMGCATALHAACQRPDQVAGLVLVIPPTAWEWREKMKRNYSVLANIMKCTRGLPLRLLGLLRIKRNDKDFQKDMLAILTRHLARVKPEGVVGAMRGASLSDFPPREDLAKLDMPVLILAWPDDATHPLAVAEELHNTLPNKQLDVMRTVDGAFQWPQLVRKFITSLN